MKQNRLITLLIGLCALVGTPALAAGYLLEIEKPNQEGTVKVYQLNGVEVPHQGTVNSGESYRVIVAGTGAEAANYLFDRIEVTGGRNIQVVDKAKGECTFTVSTTGTVKIKSYFVGKPQTITLTPTVATEGSYTVICNGTRIANGGKVPYGSPLTIIATPKPGYAVDLIQGEPAPENNQYTIAKVTADVTVSVTFKVVTPKITFSKNGSFEFKVLSGEESLTSGSTVPYGTRLKVTVKDKNANIYNLRVNNTFPQVTQVSVDSAYVELVAQTDLKIDLVNVQAKMEPQIYYPQPEVHVEYDGQPKAFDGYRFVPNGLSGIPRFKAEGANEYTTEKPTEIGRYWVDVYRIPDAEFGESYFSWGDALLVIDPIALTLQTLPTATLVNGVPTLSGGLVTAKGAAVAGSFAFETVPTETGLTKVIFSPTLTDRYRPISCMVPISFDAAQPITKHQISSVGLPVGVTLQVRNGDYLLAATDYVAAGTKLTLQAIGLPEGKEVKYFLNRTSSTSHDPIEGNTIQVTQDFELSLLLADKPALPTLTPNGEIKQKAIYTGVHQRGNTFGIVEEWPDFDHWIITYTHLATNTQVISPKQVGEYRMDMVYPSDGKYETFETTGTYIVTQGDPKVNFATVKGSAVAQGQPLSLSLLSGGTSEVPGTFVWKDPEQKAFAGVDHEVLFVPTDANYATKSGKVSIAAAAVPSISFAPQNGSITVINKQTGKTVKSGDWLTVGDELTITATPATQYALNRLSVNGYLFPNGATYLVGDQLLTIEATFQLQSGGPHYTVTIPKVIGAWVQSAGKHEVTSGNSFSFDVDYNLLYGAPTVKAGGKKLGFDGVSRYTLQQVTQDTTVVITLSRYGQYAVTAPADTTLGQITIEPIADSLATRADQTAGYPYGTQLKLTALPRPGVQFQTWWDGSTENPRTYIVRSAQAITAKLTGTPTGLEAIASPVVLWTAKGMLNLQTTSAYQATITDVLGRVVDRLTVEGFASCRIAQPGVYIVTLLRANQVIHTQKVTIP